MLQAQLPAWLAKVEPGRPDRCRYRKRPPTTWVPSPTAAATGTASRSRTCPPRTNGSGSSRTGAAIFSGRSSAPTATSIATTATSPSTGTRSRSTKRMSRSSFRPGSSGRRRLPPWSSSRPKGSRGTGRRCGRRSRRGGKSGFCRRAGCSVPSPSGTPSRCSFSTGSISKICFGDRVQIEASVQGRSLRVRLENLRGSALDGKLEVRAAPELELLVDSSVSLSLVPGTATVLTFDIRPRLEAMGRANPVLASFTWDGGKKRTLAVMDLPPAVSTHKLLVRPGAGRLLPRFRPQLRESEGLSRSGSGFSPDRARAGRSTTRRETSPSRPASSGR